MYNICFIVGSRPNFVKAASVYQHLSKTASCTVFHTGQHYSENMSYSIYNELKLPIHLNLNQRTSDRHIMAKDIAIQLYLLNPVLVIVFGDVNSTYAGAWAAKRIGIPIVHVEAGLRSHNWKMEEEFNRYFVDSISDLLIVSEIGAQQNLEREFNNKQIKLCGQTHIDTLYPLVFEKFPQIKKQGIMTIHRRENLNSSMLSNILKIQTTLKNQHVPLFLFAHPHLIKVIKELNIPLDWYPAVSYSKFLQQMRQSSFIITDSGGVAQEAAFFNIPCVIYRTENEHKIIESSKNLISQDTNIILQYCLKTLNAKPPKVNMQLKNNVWGDGQAGKRTADQIMEYLNANI